MSLLYLTPLTTETTDRARGEVGSAIEQAGLLDQSGTAVENIATESVDYRKQGRIPYSKTIARKVAEELNSLSESGYVALPLYDSQTPEGGRKRGYYEVSTIDVTPAQEGRDDAYTYDARLTLTGTREDLYRAVDTSVDTVDGLHGTTADTFVGIASEATEVVWYDPANGATPATPADTVTAEFGDVDRYDPADAPATSPTLAYSLPFEHDGPTDVRVYDTRDRPLDKYADTTGVRTIESGETVSVANGETVEDPRVRIEDGGTLDIADGGTYRLTSTFDDTVNVWTHAYHTGFDFDGRPVIDNGLVRLWLGGHPYPLNDPGLGWEVFDDGWHPREPPATGWSVTAWDLTRVGPAHTRVQLTLSDGTDTTRVNGTIDRGEDRVLWTQPDNVASTPSGVVDLLAPIGRDTDAWVGPEQATLPKADTRA